MGFASSKTIQLRHSAEWTSGASELLNGFILRQSSVITRLMTVVFWRISRQAVRKPKTSASQRTGRTRDVAKLGALISERALSTKCKRPINSSTFAKPLAFDGVCVALNLILSALKN